MTLWIIRTLMTVVIPATVTFGQAKPTYRLDFRMQESGASGSPASSTRYSLLVQNGARGKINASRRIPFYTSLKGDTKESIFSSKDEPKGMRW